MTGPLRHIIVTGGAGFVGSEVVRQLLAKGYAVRVVDNLSKWDSKVSPGYEFLEQDLADTERTRQAFEGMDACINLAAKIGGIGYFHKFPATILSENNRIYSNTFEAAVHGLQRMVYVSSSMVFESTTTFPSVEEDVQRIPPPLTAYGFSKLIGEWYCRAFQQQYGLAYTIIRPFNAFGTDEQPGEQVGDAHVIPDLVHKGMSGQYPLELLGDGEQTRCFTHVRDIARGIIMAMESDQAVNEDFNLGTSEETRIIDLAKIIFEMCRPGEPFQARFVRGFEADLRRRVPDASKARRVLGWAPRVTLREGLVEIVESMRQRIGKGGAS